MIMRSSVLLAFLFVTGLGCNQSSDLNTTPPGQPAKPSAKTAQDIISDADYRHVFTSQDSGIAYYVREYRESPEGFGSMPELGEALVVAGTSRFFYVGIKDDKIREAIPVDDVGVLTGMLVDQQEKPSP